MQIKNLVQIELLLNHSKGFEALILKMDSYFPFETQVMTKSQIGGLIHNH